MPKFRAVKVTRRPDYALNLQTKHFNAVAEVIEVYVYDPKSVTYCCEPVTYCCELTPSRGMQGLYTAIYCVDGTPDEICEYWNEIGCENGRDDCYMWAMSADKLPYEFDDLE